MSTDKHGPGAPAWETPTSLEQDDARDLDDYDEDDQPCIGEGCINPHVYHFAAECFTLAMAEDQHDEGYFDDFVERWTVEHLARRLVEFQPEYARQLATALPKEIAAADEATREHRRQMGAILNGPGSGDLPF